MPPDNEPTAVFPLLSSQSVQSQQAEFLMKLSHATLYSGTFQPDLFYSCLLLNIELISEH